MSETNELTTTTNDPPVSAATLEHVLGTGDLSLLTIPQRVEYYRRTCQTLGLNPLTRPFRFVRFQNGEVQLYATKDCTEQLRSLRDISLEIVSRNFDAGVYTVTTRAQMPNGRKDEDIGSVALSPQATGEFRANGMMRATTKSKRRVTLSICGLGGMPDESEIDSIPGGVVTFDPDQPLPAAPPTIDAPKQSSPPPPDQYPFVTAKGIQGYSNAAEWMERWRRLIEACQRTQGLDKLREARDLNRSTFHAIEVFDPDAVAEIGDLLTEALEG